MPRKSYPSSKAIFGMYFPSSASSGNYVPFQRQIPGRIFRKPAHPESPSHFGRIRARNHRPIRPPINKEASSRTAGHEVHREFRTQRRPLNVAFVLRRTVEQAILCLAPSPGPTCFKPQLRQRNTAEPAPTHARASAIEANKRVKRLRRNGALVAHNDAAANVDTHMTVDKARSTRAAV